MGKRAFGNLELSVLQILKSGEKKTVKEVHQLLGGKDKYTTIMTVLLRLSKKNILARNRVDNHYEYWLLPPAKKIPTLVDQIKKSLFGVKPLDLVTYLIDSDEEISDDELKVMEQMIDKAKKRRRK